MISIAKPSIGKDEINAVTEVLKSGRLTQGAKVKEFEEKFAKYIGTKHAIATSSGTTALHVALLAAGIRAGDEVITTPFSFIASANCILFCGAKPVFVDIDDLTFNINSKLIEQKITEKTKAIIPVHLYGQACDMDRIMEIAKKHNLYVIEDACQAHGALYKGKKVGSFGLGCFSFYGTKNITTGEGGMITTNDDVIAEKARMIREHGAKQRYYHKILGYNFRMTDIVAAIGIEQLKKIEKFNKAREKNAKYLTKKLNSIKGIVLPVEAVDRKHAWHQYTIRVTEDRDKLKQKLNEKGIGAEIYYPLAIHQQELYKGLGYNDSLPKAEKAAKEALSLPIHPAVTKKDLDFIVKSIEQVMK